jgi:hypothetical protein
MFNKLQESHFRNRICYSWQKRSSENAWACFIWSSYTAEGVVFGIEIRETWLAG